MAILNGYINLSKIDKNLITENRHGDKIIWVDLYTYDQADQFGNTACVATYDGRTKQKNYIANFRPKELKKSSGFTDEQGTEDLGF